MKTVIRSKGQEFICLYDAQDEELINSHKWHLGDGYVRTYISGKLVRLHRLIMNVEYPLVIDHRNHDPLDNRRENLRVCTQAENKRNRLKYKGRIPLKGVCRDGHLYRAQISENGKRKNIGRFRSAITAAKQYDRTAREIYKDFACVNFPDITTNEIQLEIF